MKEETQQEILKHVDRLIVDTHGCSYEQVISSVRCAMDNKVFSAVILALSGFLLPRADNREQFDQCLDRIDTEAKLKALLVSLNEPAGRERLLIFSALKHGLPIVRRFLIKTGKQLPVPRGGRPELLSDPDKQRSIREEIRRLRTPRSRLKEIFKEIAKREGVSPKKIRQVWLDDERNQIDGER